MCQTEQSQVIKNIVRWITIKVMHLNIRPSAHATFTVRAEFNFRRDF
jgi:hypothetical protein